MDARETSIYATVLIAAFIIGGIFIFYIISIMSHQRQMRRLYYARILAEITALEKERTRISADLHDELGPILSAIKLGINDFNLIDQDDLDSLHKVNDRLDDAIKRIRMIARDLWPDSLVRKGLPYAVKEFTDHINKVSKLKVDFSYTAIPHLAESKTINIYRILQELIHNAIKHGNAAHLRIRLFIKSNQLVLIAEDDGIGFDYDKAVKEQNGLGLRNILSRTDLLNGDMYVDSKKGSGTRYTIKLPM